HVSELGKTERDSLASATAHADAALDRSEQTAKQRNIADAATRLFMAQGYAEVSMDAIARAAGVSKATLYAYFASKERLFASLVGEACTRSGPGSPTLSDNAADVRETLATLAGQALRLMLEEQSLAVYRLVIAESAPFPELGHAFYERGPARGRRNLAAWLEQRWPEAGSAGRTRNSPPSSSRACSGRTCQCARCSASIRNRRRPRLRLPPPPRWTPSCAPTPPPDAPRVCSGSTPGFLWQDGDPN
ncbi:MAG: TetR/AcrR family transcriptional regulator, partial [Acetobacteraceae bacterium]